MKEQLYLQAFVNTNQKAIEKGAYTHDDIKKLVFYGVRYVNIKRGHDTSALEEAEGFYEFITAISNFIGHLTPNEFMNIFPVSKEYDGHKYECKDYYYTMEYLDTLEMDKQIKEQSIDNGSIIGFLWEYHNWEVRRFTVALTASLSRLQRFQGQSTITDNLFDMLGLETHTLYENNGKQFLMDSKGKTTALNKPLPRYLRQLK
nr:MAG TPA: hypothetical protein [Caudoviricetes sp.]